MPTCVIIDLFTIDWNNSYIIRNIQTYRVKFFEQVLRIHKGEFGYISVRCKFKKEKENAKKQHYHIDFYNSNVL